MRPSLAKILSSDYLVLLSLLVPVIFWLVWLDSVTTQFLYLVLPRGNGRPVDPTVFVWIAIAGSVVFIPLLVYRTSSIYRHFADAEIVTGMITMVHVFRDRGRIEYDYVWQGKRYHSGNAIHKNRTVLSLVVGQQVELAVSIKNPHKALVRKLYMA